MAKSYSPSETGRNVAMVLVRDLLVVSRRTERGRDYFTDRKYRGQTRLVKRREALMVEDRRKLVFIENGRTPGIDKRWRSARVPQKPYSLVAAVEGEANGFSFGQVRERANSLRKN